MKTPCVTYQLLCQFISKRRHLHCTSKVQDSDLLLYITCSSLHFSSTTSLLIILSLGVGGKVSVEPDHTSCSSNPLFTLPNRPTFARLFRGMGRVFTLLEVNCLLELAPQFTLPDPTHIGGLFSCKCN